MATDLSKSALRQPPSHLRPGAGMPTSDSVNRQSSATGLGMGFMSLGDDDSDDEDEKAPVRSIPSRTSHRSPPPPAYPQAPGMVPLSAPKPGYVAQVQMPSPVHEKSDPFADGAGAPPDYPRSPNTVSGTDPHPLRPPMTPIQPVFARPAKNDNSVQFGEKSIMRGVGETPVNPRRGQQGDDFWRRFSMVVRDENEKKPNEKKSRWLRTTETGYSRLSKWVWCIGLALLLIIGAISGLGYYYSHQHQVTTKGAPSSFGSKDDNLHDSEAVPSQVQTSGGKAATSVHHVSPTNTVAKRLALPVPTHNGSALRRHAEARERKRHLNRVTDLD